MLRSLLRRLSQRVSLSRPPRSSRPELLELESRTLLSAVTWLNPAGGDWDTVANWDAGRLPAATDDASIPFAGITVTHATGASDSVHSLTSAAGLDLSSGHLAIGSPDEPAATPSQIDDLFSVSGDGVLTLSNVALGGAGTVRNANVVNLTSSTLDVGLDNEAGMVHAGGATTLNHQADRPLVNGPDATLDLRPAATLTVAGGFTNQGGITVGAGGTFTVSGGTFLQSGTVDGSGTLALAGTTATFAGDLSNAVTGLSLTQTTLTLGGTLTNVGTLDLGGSTINGPVDNQGNLTVQTTGARGVINGPLTSEAGATVSIQGSLTTSQDFSNDGLLVLSGVVPMLTTPTLTNGPDGTMSVAPGITGAFLNTHALTNSGFLDLTLNTLTVGFTGPGASAVNGGSISVGAEQSLFFEGGDFTNSGTVEVASRGTLLTTGQYTQSAGLTLLSEAIVIAGAPVDLEGGALLGTGMINASVVNNAEVDVGEFGSPGILVIRGSYTQTANGVLVVRVGGPDFGTDFDQLRISGQATLDGSLTVHLINGFVPTSGDRFQVLTFRSATGAFATLDGDGPAFTPRVEATDVTLVAN
jgi:hypothetical protein